MDSKKIENLLNLSLSVDTEERRKSSLLWEGFDAIEDTWEIIIKYQGDILQYASGEIIIEPLIAGYAIVTLPERLLEEFVANPEIEYVEKPKTFYFQDITALRESCISSVTTASPYLTGAGVLVAILDSSIDFYNENFRKSDGTTRILAIWDQSLSADELNRRTGNETDNEETAGIEGEWFYEPPVGFVTGVEFSQEQINAALSNKSEAKARSLIPTVDISGHGTAVAGILAASGTAKEPFRRGVVPQASLLIVKLGTSRTNTFPRTTEIMRGVTYALQKARQFGMPLVINLSFGNTYGDHRGNSLLERFLDNAAEIGRTSIVVGSGNEGATYGHLEGILQTGESRRIELAVANYEKELNVQLWKRYQDVMEITLVTPGGEQIEIPMHTGGAYRYRTEGVTLLIYVGEPLPYMVFQEVYIDFITEEGSGAGITQNQSRQAAGGYIPAGIWSFELVSRDSVYGDFQFFLPSGTIRATGTRFIQGSPQVTLTVPSTASRVITVGAYDMYSGSYADFSGRGYVYGQAIDNPSRSEGVASGVGREDALERKQLIHTVKPDLAAPGVNIETVSVRGGYTRVSGTSYATPIVSGAAALLMEWGIVRGNDVYLYGEKLKAYLIKGARTLPGEERLPNDKIGAYGIIVSS